MVSNYGVLTPYLWSYNKPTYNIFYTRLAGPLGEGWGGHGCVKLLMFGLKPYWILL